MCIFLRRPKNSKQTMAKSKTRQDLDYEFELKYEGFLFEAILMPRPKTEDPRLRCQMEASMSRPSQTENTYVQTNPDGCCLCPDIRGFASLSFF